MEPIIQEILADIKFKYDDEIYNDISNILTVKLHDYKIEKIIKNEVVVYEMSDSQKQYNMFFVAKQIEGLSSKSLLFYRQTIDKMIEFLAKPFDQVTTDDCRYYLAYYQTNNKVSTITVDNTRRILTAFFQWLEDEEYIPKNPLKKIKRIKSEKIEKKAFTTKEIELLRIEAEKIKSEEKKKRMIALIEFLLSTATRVSELTNTKISDINFETGDVLVHGKGNKQRTVYLSPRALLRYKEYLNIRKNKSPYAFTSLKKVAKDKNKGKLENSSVETIIRELGEQSNIENVHPHRFRRTCATNLMKSGMPIEEISKYLGHESIATTQIYLDLGADTVRQSCEKYIK